MHIVVHVTHIYAYFMYIYTFQIGNITKQLTTQIPTNQWTFGCCTGVTPWHGGGLGAVRL